MAKPKKVKGKAKDSTPKLHGVRNPFACAPIMRKACVHEVTNKAKRKKAKLAMKKALSKRDFDGAFSFCRVINRKSLKLAVLALAARLKKQNGVLAKFTELEA